MSKKEGNQTVTEPFKQWMAQVASERIDQIQDLDLFQEHKQVARQGGEVARNARLELEAKTGKKVVSPLNAKKSFVLEGGGE